MHVLIFSFFSPQVCELHFHPSDIETETSAFDPKTGKIITAKLDRTRIKKGAIPKLFPGCPEYLSSDQSERDAPEEKRNRLENAHLQRAIQESLKSKEVEDEKYLCSNFTEFLNCLKFITIPPFWTTVNQETSVLFLHRDVEEVPRLKCSVLVNENLDVKAFIGSVELKKSCKKKFSETLSDVRHLYTILDHVESISID